MSVKTLHIPKTLREVDMWVHPEGLVKGAIYVAIGDDKNSQEDPRHVLNTEKPFLVLRRDSPEEIRFYNRASIIRVEYAENRPDDNQAKVIHCRITMMDGSVLDGDIIEILPPEYARLYDYLNQGQERFIRLFTDVSQVCMVNKNYIIQVTTDGD